MAFVWLVECKTCVQRYPIRAREVTTGRSTDQLTPGADAGSFECPHCHDIHEYTSDDWIPGEGKLAQS